MSSEFLTLVVSTPGRLLSLPWRALGRRVVQLGRRWSHRWWGVRHGSVSAAWLQDFEVASAKRRDR